MNTYSYPKKATERGSDYVTFSAHKYQGANETGGNQVGGGSAPAAECVIRLYMPNSTPGVSNGQSWGDGTFGSGPIGTAMRTLGVQVATDIQDIVENGKTDVSGLVDRFGKLVDDQKKNVPAIGGQLGMRAVSGLMGMAGARVSASGMQQAATGRVYNPNIELFYEGPGLREFAFNFSFIPKDPAETAEIMNIVREFKKWSAPKTLPGSMFEVPYVWFIKYKHGGGNNKYMNAFKKCAMTNITVQQNPTNDQHVTFTDGMPVVTSIAMGFKEMVVVTRDDHDDGESLMGY